MLNLFRRVLFGKLIVFSGFLSLPILFLAIGISKGYSQQLTGTLSGIVHDQSGAVIPGAQVTLKNQISGDVRAATADGAGRFVITAVQPATYSISISAT